MGRQGRPFADSLPGIDRRNAEMVRRYKAGEDFASIGVSVALTRERVRQVVKQSGAYMPWEYTCAVEGCSTSPRSPRRYCYRHQRRLELYGSPLGQRPLLREQHGTIACYQAGCSCDLCRRAEADRRMEYSHRAHPEMRRYAARNPA